MGLPFAVLGIWYTFIPYFSGKFMISPFIGYKTLKLSLIPEKKKKKKKKKKNRHDMTYYANSGAGYKIVF